MTNDLNSLRADKKKVDEELEGCELVTKWNDTVQQETQDKLIQESFEIKLEGEEYRNLDVEQQCSLIMSKIFYNKALAKGISVATKLIEDEIKFLERMVNINKRFKVETFREVFSRIKYLKSLLE